MATLWRRAFSMHSSIARVETAWPKPQWPSMRAVVGVSSRVSIGAPGTMWPFWIPVEVQGGSRWMPWESWPARLASTW